MKKIKGTYNLIKTGDKWGLQRSQSLVDSRLEDVFISMLVESRANELGISTKEYCEGILDASSKHPLTYRK